MKIPRALINRIEALPDDLRNKAMDNVSDARRDLFRWPRLRHQILEDLERAIASHEADNEAI